MQQAKQANLKKEIAANILIFFGGECFFFPFVVQSGPFTT